MCDYQDMQRDLAETRRLNRRERWKGYALEAVSWVGTLVAFYIVLRVITHGFRN